MGASAIGLALMGIGTTSNAIGQAQANRGMRAVRAAEHARQLGFDRQLAAKQDQLLEEDGAAARARDITEYTVREGDAMGEVGRNVADAYKATAASAPESQRGQITTAGDAVARSSGSLGTRLARRGAVARRMQDDQVRGRTYALDRARLADRARRSASLLPFEMEAAARRGAVMRSLAQLAMLSGQGLYSYGVNQPGGPDGYSNSAASSNRLQGPAAT